RTCQWNRKVDENGKGGFSVGPAIRDHQGLKDINTEGYTVSDVMTIGRHQARQLKGGGLCALVIGVTESSRVDVGVTGRADDDLCGLVNQFATLIESKLPGGS